MIDYKKLEKNLKRKIDANIYKKAQQIIEDEKIKIINIFKDKYNEDLLIILAQYLSDAGYYENLNIYIDTEKNEINECRCQCKNRYYTKDTYCKHVSAAIIIFCGILKEQEKEEQRLYDNMGINLIDAMEFNNSLKERIKLDVIINTNKAYKEYNISFKIGSTKMYVLKNLEEFAEAHFTNTEIVYGKGFTYSPSTQEFDEKDEKVREYIEEFINVNYEPNYPYASFGRRKQIRLNSISISRFIKCLVGKTITMDSKKYEVIEQDIPIIFNLKKHDDKYILNLKNKGLRTLGLKNDTYIYEDKIYIPSKKQRQSLKEVFWCIDKYGEIQFKKQDENRMFNSVICRIEGNGTNVNIDSSVNNIIKDELKAEFFLDYDKRHMTLDVDLKYGDNVLKFYNMSEKTENIVLRDNNKEQDILKKISELDFTYGKDKFLFNGDEEAFIGFLVEGYKQFESLGEVFYSDRLKERKVYNRPSISAGINSGEGNYLEINFKIDDIDPAEYKNILNAYREKRKYYKLKNNSFINLNNDELNDFLGFIDSIDPDNTTGRMKIGRNKAVVVSDYLNDKNISFIRGKEIVDDISKKILNLKDLEFDIPDKLNAKLRDYQITGYRWFKNLSYLGFGGILSDEMGLGKTLQTITFLLSEEKKKTLIVTPASLIYNWKNEFAKFAPSMRVAISHGSRNEREKIIYNMDEYDVILTTYGTLKNDEEKYNDINFDYCILDEAQNIKNPMAQITRSIKKIVAKNKFALTGTPIENNLIELWSIFDFIMPGYLENVHKFKNRFVNNNDSVIDLQKYIKPFMLRRLKKDVISELPEKIEKNHYVELTTQQKKIYTAYVKKVKKDLEETDYEEDKITIFSYLTKLRQLCLDPSVIIDDYKGKNSKMDELVSILNDMLEEKHKILVFSQFTSVLKNIAERLNEEKINYCYLDGSTPPSKRFELVEKFNNGKEENVFLISLKAGGTGLNLTSADIVIHFDPWWNPAVEEQATDRAHRIGQKHVVQVIKLISQGTIEEKIIDLQEGKRKLINNVLDSNFTSENILRSMSNEEIKALFE